MSTITHSECVQSLSYPACKAHAPYYIVICGLSGSMIFFPMAQFSDKKLLNIKYVFRFLLQLLSETFLILRIIQQDIIINVHGSSCEVPVTHQILMILDFS